MDASPQIILEFKKNMPGETWLWVLAALRHDHVVWQSLNDPLFAKQALTLLPQNWNSWTPAALALLKVSPEHTPDELGVSPLAPLPAELRAEAIQAYQEWLKGGKYPNLQQAGLLALALREYRRRKGSWDDLEATLGTLDDRWSTPLACVYAMIPDPDAMLKSLLNSADQDIAVNLAVHVLLSNPASVSDQRDRIQSVIHDLPIDTALLLLNGFRKYHPTTAIKISEEFKEGLATKGDELITGSIKSDKAPAWWRLQRQIEQLGELIEHAESHRLADNPVDQASFLLNAAESARQIQGHLVANYAQALLNTKPECGSQSYELILDALRRSTQLVPETTDYAILLASTLADCNQLTHEDAFLADLQNNEDVIKNVRFSIFSLRMSQRSGILDEARDAALRALEQVGSGADLKRTEWIELSRYFLDNSMFSEAAKVADLGLKEYSLDLELMIILAQATLAQGDPKAALPYLAFALGSMNEEQSDVNSLEIRPELQVLWIQCLEALGEWHLALEERQEALSRVETPVLDDLHALAHCAIHAGEIDQAITACQKALEIDLDDADSHGLLAQALLSTGETEAAIEHYRHAVGAMPAKEEWWLALADLYRGNGRDQEALDTLRAAAQAVPDRSGIRLALGETYLSMNAPTQAVSCLRTVVRTSFSVQAALRLGQALQQIGHLEEARQVLHRGYLSSQPGIEALEDVGTIVVNREEIDPYYPALVNLYAQVLIDSGDFIAAKPVLEGAIETHPQNPGTRLMLAELILDEKESEDIPRALEILLPIIDESGSVTQDDQAKAQALLAEVYERGEEYEKSIQAYLAAWDTPLTEVPAWRRRLALGLGRVAIKIKQPEKALDALRMAIQYSPSDIELQKSLYHICEASSRIDEAYQAIQAVLGTDSSSLDTLIWYADQGLLLSDTPEGRALGARGDAIDALNAGLELAPERDDILLKLGDVYLQDEQFEAANDVLSKLIDLQKLEHVSKLDLFRVAQRTRNASMNELAAGLLARAVQFFEQRDALQGDGLDVEEENMSIFSELANIQYELGKYDDALSVLDQALQLAPEDKSFHLEKANLLMDLQQYEEARVPLDKALQIDPEDAYTHYHKARLEQFLGQIPTAYYHSVQSICHADETKDASFLGQARLQAAQLADITMRPRQARAYLWDEATPQDQQVDRFAHVILLAELALDERDVATASQLVDRADEIDPQHPQTLTAKARLARLQGDMDTGLTNLNAAVKSIHIGKDDWDKVKPNQRRNRIACYRSACRTALEFKDWDNAYLWACIAAERGRDEPLSQFMKAQVLTIRAEQLRRCELFNIQRHAPKAEALSEDAWHEFEAAILEVERQVEAIGVLLDETGESLWGDEAFQALNLWRARGNGAFHPSFENAVTLQSILKDQSPNPQALSALILVYMAAGEAKRVVQVLRAEWPMLVDHPLVMTHLAVALEEIDETQALDYAQTANRIVADGACPECPEQPILDYLVAQLAAKAGELHLAQEAIQDALGEWPDEPRWLAFAASIFLEDGISDTSQTKKIDDEDPQGKALRFLEQAVSMEPEFANHHLALGHLYRQRGDYQRAIAAFEQAGMLEPELAKPWLELANTQIITGDLEAAETNSARALEFAKNDLDVIMLNAEISLQLENYSEAHTKLKEVLRLKENHPQALRKISEVLEGLGRTDEALSTLERALPLFGFPLDMQLQHVRLIYRARGYEAALPRLKNLIDRYPGDTELKVTLAEWYFQNGEGKKALEIARSALNDDQADIPSEQRADLNYLIGLQARQEGQLDQAVHALSEAISANPGHIEALLALGQTYQTRRELRQALAIYQRAIGVTVSDYRPYYYAGQVLKDLKDYIQAEKMLRHAAQIAPDEVLVHRLLGAVTVLNLVHSR